MNIIKEIEIKHTDSFNALKIIMSIIVASCVLYIFVYH